MCQIDSEKTKGDLELASQKIGGVNIFHLPSSVINQKCPLEAKSDISSHLKISMFNIRLSFS